MFKNIAFQIRAERRGLFSCVFLCVCSCNNHYKWMSIIYFTLFPYLFNWIQWMPWKMRDREWNKQPRDTRTRSKKTESIARYKDWMRTRCQFQFKFPRPNMDIDILPYTPKWSRHLCSLRHFFCLSAASVADSVVSTITLAAFHTKKHDSNSWQEPATRFFPIVCLVFSFVVCFRSFVLCAIVEWVTFDWTNNLLSSTNIPVIDSVTIMFLQFFRNKTWSVLILYLLVVGALC